MEWVKLTTTSVGSLRALGAVRYSRFAGPAAAWSSASPHQYQPVRLCLRSPTPSLEAVRKLRGPPLLILFPPRPEAAPQPSQSPLPRWLPVGLAMQKLPWQSGIPLMSRVRRPRRIEGLRLTWSPVPPLSPSIFSQRSHTPGDCLAQATLDVSRRSVR
jgi:hypothetical protein